MTVVRTSKLIREGECIRCGKCCKSVSIMLHTDKDRPDGAERVEDYCKWLDYHHVAYKRDVDFIELTVGGVCKHFDTRNGQSICLIYDKRPLVCQEFPNGPNSVCPGFTFREEVVNDMAKEPIKEKETTGTGTDKQHVSDSDTSPQGEGAAKK